MNGFPFTVRFSRNHIMTECIISIFKKINLVIILQGRTFEMMTLFLDNSMYPNPEISSKKIFILIVEKQD